MLSKPIKVQNTQSGTIQRSINCLHYYHYPLVTTGDKKKKNRQIPGEPERSAKGAERGNFDLGKGWRGRSHTSSQSSCPGEEEEESRPAPGPRTAQSRSVRLARLQLFGPFGSLSPERSPTAASFPVQIWPLAPPPPP